MLCQKLVLFLFIVFFSTAAFAGFAEGKKAYDEQDWVRAIYHLRPLAETGDGRALIILGNMYAEGYGVLKDEKEAFIHYYRAAFEKNNPTAMVAVAAMLQSGTGVPKNMTLAKEWFGKAAALGNQSGAFFYAIILYQGFKGEGVDLQPDHKAALQWFLISAREDILERDPQMAAAAKGLVALIKPKVSIEEVTVAEKDAADFKISSSPPPVERPE